MIIIAKTNTKIVSLHSGSQNHETTKDVIVNLFKENIFIDI